MPRFNLLEPLKFQGKIESGGQGTPVNFLASIDDSGEVNFEFDRLSFDRSTRFISDKWHGEGRFPASFNLSGDAEDGTTFRSDSIYFNSIGPNWEKDKGTYLVLKGYCSEASFIVKKPENVESSSIKMLLKGFKSFSSNCTVCELGLVGIAGASDFDDPDKITGYIAIERNSKEIDYHNWRIEADKLIEHTRRIFSFSSGVNLRFPVTLYYHDNLLEYHCISQTEQMKSNFPVFHFMMHDKVLECSVKSYFNPPIIANDLFYIIEWLSMNSTYNEIRLVSGMTALENLIDSNSIENEAFFFKISDFEKTKKALRQSIRENMSKYFPEISLDDFNKYLPGKINELNRRPIRDKIYLLARRWGVSLEGITEKMIGDAITARNNVIHRGSYYDIGRDQLPLIEHAMVIREVVLRFVMASIGYDGQYISQLGGYHHAHYPPVQKSQDPTS